MLRRDSAQEAYDGHGTGMLRHASLVRSRLSWSARAEKEVLGPSL